MEYNENDHYREYEPPKSTTEIIIGNILKAVVCIFLIVIGFFVIILVMSILNTQTAVEYITYTNDFTINNPTLSQTVYTSNPLLSSVGVQAYNSSNASYGHVPSTDWTYDSSTTSITINAGALSWDITALHVSANTDYAEPPAESVLTAWAFALIILAVASIGGIIAYSRYRDNY